MSRDQKHDLVSKYHLGKMTDRELPLTQWMEGWIDGWIDRQMGPSLT